MNIKEFFYFQKSDRQVMLVLLTVIMAALIVFFAVGGRNDSTQMMATDSVDANEYTDPAARHSHRYAYHGRQGRTDYMVEARPAERFPFDPNTADSSQLLRLGLQPWQVKNIYRYRAKGGVYRKPSDFARLYGLTVKQFRELEPYIRISSDYQPAASLYAEREQDAGLSGARHADSLRFPVKLKAGEQILLNQADTNQLKRVPGIGSGYARAIVRYGKRLGGYVSVEQLREIEGFPEEALPFFAMGTPEVEKMNVNQLSLNQLRNHPYMGYFRAKAIVDYRRLHGRINNLDDLCLLKEFPPEAVQRLRAYVAY